MLNRSFISATRPLVHLQTQWQPTMIHSSTRPCIGSTYQFYHRPFSSSLHRYAADKSHYDVLGVLPSVSKADLKKKFYTLSRETHPDMNKNDPTASDRFSEISEAYAVLGNDEKRRRYDRDVMPRFSRAQTRSGSYSSSSGLGARPATGLSKRRGTFRGRPPSYYSQSAGSEEERMRREQEAYQAGFGQGRAGAFDPSQYTGPGGWDPTFNAAPIYRTQTMEDQRRNQRRSAEMAAAQAAMQEDGAFWGRFIIVSGIVGFAVIIGTVIGKISNPPRGGIVRADGTRRQAASNHT